MCLLTLAVLIASPIFAQAQATDTPPAAQDLRQTALGFRNAQDFDKAIEIYKTLLAENPPDALSLKVDLGLCYKAKKDYANAMPLFTEVAASQDKRKAESMFYIENCYCEQGKTADAIVELTKAYTDCPEARADVLLRRAARECDIQKYKEALADYQEFLAKYPDKTDLIATFSARLPEIRLRATGLFDGPASGLEAEWTRAKADDSDPAYVNLVACRLGLAYKSEQDYSKAIAIFEDLAKDAQGDRCRGLTFWALDCLTEQEKNEEALVYLDKMLAAHPDWKPQVLNRQAICLGELGRSDECLACWDKLIDECPGTQEAVIAQVAHADVELFVKNDASGARSRLQRFMTEHPDYQDMLYVRDALATTYYSEGDFARAADAYAEGLKYNDYGTWHPFFLYMMGDCYKNLGDAANAKDAWSKLSTLYPTNAWIRFITDLSELNSKEAGK